MNDHIEAQGKEHNAAPQRGRRWLLAGVATTVVAALSVVGISYAGDGPGCRGQHGMGMHGALDPAAAAKHIDGMIDHLLADGTPEQKAKLSAIAKAALEDLRPLREQHRAARDQGIMLLAQASVDRAALEQVRARELQLAEQVSRRLTQALADTADVLTPEQRAKLAERFKHRLEHMG